MNKRVNVGPKNIVDQKMHVNFKKMLLLKIIIFLFS